MHPTTLECVLSNLFNVNIVLVDPTYVALKASVFACVAAFSNLQYFLPELLLH